MKGSGKDKGKKKPTDKSSWSRDVKQGGPGGKGAVKIIRNTNRGK